METIFPESGPLAQAPQDMSMVKLLSRLGGWHRYKIEGCEDEPDSAQNSSSPALGCRPTVVFWGVLQSHRVIWPRHEPLSRPACCPQKTASL